MKLSIFTTITTPKKRGDNWKDSLQDYYDLADELVVIDGSATKPQRNDVMFTNTKTKHIYNEWPKEFSWEFIGEQFQRGYEACTGDWVIHADLDFIFHEKDFEAIRKACERNKESAALSFYKWQFLLPDRYNLKSRLVIAVNKGKYGDRIKFDSGGDLCQPSLDGIELKPGEVPEAGIEFYNYEKILKTKEQIKDDAGRMARAWESYFGEYKLGGPDEESAYREWLVMMAGRFEKPQRIIPLSAHPKYMQETIKNLKAENLGYNGHGNLRENTYVQNR